MSVNKFKSEANLSPMLEKTIMQILKKNGILQGNKTFGIVEEVLNKTTLIVYLQQSNSSEQVKCSPNIAFGLGDRVLVEYINNNPHDRFVMGVISYGEKFEPIDYDNLPTEPVEIIRNEQGQAYRFIYGYNKPNTTWTQELTRNEKGQVVDVIHSYPDGFILIRRLLRNTEDKVYKYE